MGLPIFLLLSTLLLSTSHADDFDEVNPIQLLRPRSGVGGHPVDGIDCLSWRLAVETNNLRGWKSVPMSCEDYVGNYMLGKQYRNDCDLVADAAIAYAESVKPADDGNDIWVFDLDETTLSNLPYYARNDVQFGATPYNRTKFYEWLAEGTSPAVPAVLRLYKRVLELGFQPVIISGLSSELRKIRIKNLKKEGYRKGWLILKSPSERGTSALVYKSKKRTELVKQGYRIVGNVGDQWSDLLGENAGNRTFKVPDPMYYVG